ncbi:hypothetical protein B0H14DRAFT_2611884 [Mycena olivaceomarginata]|nr:hypothetical protein B0H14DRAFT_2611884 [Mycena olivaceomarginata]
MHRQNALNQTEMETYMLGAWFAHYPSLNKRDSIWMKLFVAGLVLLTTLKSLQSLAMMWIQNVTLFGDREAASNIWQKHWVWYNQHHTGSHHCVLCPDVFLSPSLVHSLLAQAISRNVYLVITCITLFLLGLVSGVVMTFYIFTNTMEVAVRWGVPSDTHINAPWPADQPQPSSPLTAANTAGK